MRKMVFDDLRQSFSTISVKGAKFLAHASGWAKPYQVAVLAAL